jgi:WbqC-like protein family
MIVAIHQPHYLPWLGYLHRMAQADLFVLLDHVQFERANYQNRTRILTDGAARWLTVPVVQRSQKERIHEKEVEPRGEGARWWGPNHYATLRHAYRKAPHLAQYAPELKRIFEAPWSRLVDLNLAALGFLRDALGIRTPLVRSSELGVEGAKSELILRLCRAVGADTFLGGLGGTRAYLDAAAFERAGIAVRWQEFAHPRYAQHGAPGFVAGLSSVDLLFNCGSRSRDLLLKETDARAPLIA